ncbi:MAG TPA: hypothetical protein VK178_18950 [Opitutaceae bacterium]|nr:hypothetical protein [Opitutaceae bacterium]
MPQPQPPRPTLEDLLRFKRAERPSPEFWAEFDRGLRQKQLAALMKRPKGWARWSPVLGRSLRWAVPATAAAAVALVVVQIPFSTASRPVPVEVASRSAVDQTSPTIPLAHAPSLTTVAVASRPHGDEKPATAAIAEVAPSTATEVASVVPTETERTLPWSAASLSSGSSFRMGAVTLASVSAAPEPRRSRSSWTSRFNEITREMSAQQASERMLQLASLDLPSTGQPALDSATAALAPTGTASRQRSERDFRDLESRFGVTGSSLSIKF